MSNVPKPIDNADKAKVSELLLYFLNEKFTDERLIGSIVKEVTIVFDSKPDFQQLEDLIPRKINFIESDEFCWVYDKELHRYRFVEC